MTTIALAFARPGDDRARPPKCCTQRHVSGERAWRDRGPGSGLGVTPRAVSRAIREAFGARRLVPTVRYPSTRIDFLGSNGASSHAVSSGCESRERYNERLFSQRVFRRNCSTWASNRRPRQFCGSKSPAASAPGAAARRVKANSSGRRRRHAAASSSSAGMQCANASPESVPVSPDLPPVALACACGVSSTSVYFRRRALIATTTSPCLCPSRCVSNCERIFRHFSRSSPHYARPASLTRAAPSPSPSRARPAAGAASARSARRGRPSAGRRRRRRSRRR